MSSGPINVKLEANADNLGDALAEVDRKLAAWRKENQLKLQNAVAKKKKEVDPKVADLARIGYRNDNGSKFLGQRRNAPSTGPSKEEIKAERKTERNRKRDQRRKARR